MAGPAYYTAVINIARNDDWIVPFLYVAQNPDGSTTPIDLTGSTLSMEFRVVDTDHEVLVSVASPSGGITIDNAAGGAFTIWIPVAVLQQQLPPGSYVSDLVRLMPNGLQERMIDCTVTVVEGVTR
jgi:hypothetical protein